MRVVAIVTVLLTMALYPAALHAKSKQSQKVAVKQQAAASALSEEVAKQFQEFCQEWIHKLEAREQQNAAKIKWDSQPSGVVGEYVGYYVKDHSCQLTDSSKVPVGKMTYLEVRYQKQGANISEAQQSLPHALESTAVTEIFRYDHGKWIY